MGEKLKKIILNPVGMFIIGILSGCLSRLFDIHTQILGNVFSQLQVWVMIGCTITLCSPTRRAAIINILPYCFGMLGGYYFVAAVTHGVYSKTFIIGWMLFALFSPIFACFIWRVGKRDLLGVLLGAGIITASALSSIILFDGYRFYDLIIDVLLAYLLFFMKQCKKANDGF